MQRLLALTVAILSGSFFAVTYAQGFDTASPPPAQTSANPAAAAAPSPVMTNDQFKSKLDTLNKQTKSNITQQLSQDLGGKSFAPETSTSTPAPTQTTPSTTPQDPSASTTPGSQAAPNTKKSPAAGGQSTPPSGQYYPGFGTGQPAPKSNTTGNSQDKGNSNWNVGY